MGVLPALEGGKGGLKEAMTLIVWAMAKTPYLPPSNPLIRTRHNPRMRTFDHGSYVKVQYFTEDSERAVGQTDRVLSMNWGSVFEVP